MGRSNQGGLQALQALGLQDAVLLRQDRDERGTLVLHGARSHRCRLAKSEGLSADRAHLTRRLSSPPLVCMRECTHFFKAEQPRNLGYMQFRVIKVPMC